MNNSPSIQRRVPAREPAETMDGRRPKAHPTSARIIALLLTTHTAAGAAIWLRTPNARLGDVPAKLCETPEGRAAVLAEVESLAALDAR